MSKGWSVSRRRIGEKWGKKGQATSSSFLPWSSFGPLVPMVDCILIEILKKKMPLTSFDSISSQERWPIVPLIWPAKNGTKKKNDKPFKRDTKSLNLGSGCDSSLFINSSLPGTLKEEELEGIQIWNTSIFHPNFADRNRRSSTRKKKGKGRRVCRKVSNATLATSWVYVLSWDPLSLWPGLLLSATNSTVTMSPDDDESLISAKIDTICQLQTNTNWSHTSGNRFWRGSFLLCHLFIFNLRCFCSSSILPQKSILGDGLF